MQEEKMIFQKAEHVLVSSSPRSSTWGMPRAVLRTLLITWQPGKRCPEIQFPSRAGSHIPTHVFLYLYG